MKKNVEEGAPKYYIKGAVGRGAEVIHELVCRGGKNLYNFQANNPHEILYIDKDGVIQYTDMDSDLAYVLQTSGWTEIKLKKKHKKVRTFVITVTEGKTVCNGCEFSKTCNDERMNKCDLAISLGELMGEQMNGRKLAIKEIQPF